jgi:hypothetical protein
LDSIDVSDQDPVGQREAAEKKRKDQDHEVNAGEALDNLNQDIPEILQRQPNWDIYTDDLELDLEMVDPVAFNLLGCVAPSATTKIKGLAGNRLCLKRLHAFVQEHVRWSEVKVNTRKSRDVATGSEIIKCRWNARLDMKRMMLPKWAAVAAGAAALAAAISVADPDALAALAESDVADEVAVAASALAATKFLGNRFPDVSFHFATAATRESAASGIISIDAVSRFHLNAEGRIYRHVIDNIDIRLNDKPLLMSDVEALLRLGLAPTPQIAR